MSSQQASLTPITCNRNVFEICRVRFRLGIKGKYVVPCEYLVWVPGLQRHTVEHPAATSSVKSRVQEFLVTHLKQNAAKVNIKVHIKKRDVLCIDPVLRETLRVANQ